MKHVFLIASLFIVGCSSNSGTPEIEVSNFKSGLACLGPDLELSYDPARRGICTETEKIEIQGKSTCTYGQITEPCTWYGFEFDYSNAINKTVSCVGKSSETMSYVNINGPQKSSTKSFEYDIDLEGSSGSFFNPQYSLHQTVEDDFVVETETICSSQGKELFRFKFMISFPSQEK